MLSPRPTYTSCSDLPIWNFIKVLVTGNKSFLYSGKNKPWHTAPDLTEIWDNIYSEYNELNNDTRSIHVFTLIRDITHINNKLSVIQAAVNYLTNSYSTELCTMLKSMGFMFAYQNDETLLKDLKMTISSAKSIVMERIELENELGKLDTGKESATEKDWNDLIAQLSKYMKFRIDSKNTTLMEFVSYIQAYNKDNDGK